MKNKFSGFLPSGINSILHSRDFLISTLVKTSLFDMCKVFKHYIRVFRSRCNNISKLIMLMTTGTCNNYFQKLVEKIKNMMELRISQ